VNDSNKVVFKVKQFDFIPYDKTCMTIDEKIKMNVTRKEWKDMVKKIDSFQAQFGRMLTEACMKRYKDSK